SFLPFWSENRVIERMANRDPMVYDWVVKNRETAVRNLSHELAEYRSTLIEKFGKRWLRDKGVQEHVFKYAQTWFERDGQKVPYTIDDL
ncbi:hypothetical protein ABTM70_19675, partial [Acinetobacter baumannii]